MKSEIHSAAAKQKRQPLYSKYVRQAWLFDSLIAALFVSILGSAYLNFAMRHSAVIIPSGWRENTLFFLAFLVPLFIYALVILAPLNGSIRKRVKRLSMQFLLFNIAALMITGVIIMILPLPDWLASPVILWCIPVFSMISYLYSSLFLNSAKPAKIIKLTSAE